MSGVRAAQTLSQPSQVMPSLSEPNVQAMLDVLYDILANGMDPESSEVPVQQVERFLFEHARSPKSREEFRAFFAEHGLTVRMGAAPPPVALPPIQRVVPPKLREMPARVPVELALGNDAEIVPLPFDSELSLPRPRSKRPGAIGLWAVLLCAFGLLAGGGYYGYTKIVELQGELARTAESGRDNRNALKALRDHAAGLESSVAATGELVQRMDQKSDLLINTLVTQDKSKTSRKHK